MFKFILFIPEIYFFFILFFFFIFCTVYSLSVTLKFPNINHSSIYLAITSLLYTFFLFINNIVFYWDTGILCKTQSHVLLSILFIFISIFIFIVSLKYNDINNINYLEYIIFLLISLGTLIVFLSIFNVIFIYILLELQNILISILISAKKYNRYCIEASIKYFILGSFSSLILLYGFSLIYGSTGLLSLQDINFFLFSFDFFGNQIVNYSVQISFIFISIGLLFKIYSAPFHFWVSDIYEGSPTSVLIYISSIQSLFMIFLFLKFYYYLFFDFIESKNIILSVLSVFTLILGSIGALGQVKLKKLIGYSAVTVNGFFLFSIINNNIFLLETSVMYIFIYIFTILLFFTLICNIQVNNNYLIKLSDLFNLYKLNKLTALISVLLFFSVSGLPPFIGFVSKIFWLKSFFIEYNIYIFILLFIFLIVNFYYIRLIKNIYMSYKKNNNLAFFLNKYSYFFCIVTMFLQFLLYYLLLNSSFIRNLIHILILDFVNVL